MHLTSLPLMAMDYFQCFLLEMVLLWIITHTGIGGGDKVLDVEPLGQGTNTALGGWGLPGGSALAQGSQEEMRGFRFSLEVLSIQFHALTLASGNMGCGSAPSSTSSVTLGTVRS